MGRRGFAVLLLSAVLVLVGIGGGAALFELARLVDPIAAALSGSALVLGLVALAIAPPWWRGCACCAAWSRSAPAASRCATTWEQEGQWYLPRLRFRAGQLHPVGSLDVGGFLATIGSVRPELEPIVDLDSYGDDRELNLSDGNQGEYVAAYGVLASCCSGCD